VRHRLEATAAGLAWRLCRALGPDRASALGGRLARLIGPLLPAHRVARRNLELVLPELDARARREVLRAMWDNLGRVGAEYPHLERFAAERVEVVGGEHLDRLHESGGSGILFSGHIGNWELLLPLAARRGIRMTGLYRPLNNPLVDGMLAEMRGVGGPLLPKSGGGRQVLRLLRRGGFVGMLVDQKENEGIAVPFFGRDAMTAPALAVFALAVRCPVFPAHCQRLGGGRFRLVVEPPLDVPRSGERERDVLALTTAVNARLEAWVRARPNQWFWVHRRFAKDLYR
jgi:Kdo2-lipid IVA lauroyltransferase/acyltransferase